MSQGKGLWESPAQPKGFPLGRGRVGVGEERGAAFSGEMHRLIGQPHSGGGFG